MNHILKPVVSNPELFESVRDHGGSASGKDAHNSDKLPIENIVEPPKPTGPKPLVYVSSPYTKGNVEFNVESQLRHVNTLLDDGIVWPYSPLVPSHQFHTAKERTHGEWLEYDLAMIPRCDALIRLDAEIPEHNYRQHESVGCDIEVSFCEERGIPVFYNFFELYEWAKSWQTAIRPESGQIRPQQNEDRVVYESGAIRSGDCEECRLDLIPDEPLARVGRVLAEGGKKHGEHNWRSGTPFSVPLNHLLNHIMKYKQGDKSCDHLAHAVCNLLFLMEYEATHPELDDIHIFG